MFLRSVSLVVAAAASTVVLAYPGASPDTATPARAAPDPRFTQWKAPGQGDVRSPCPGLNALANHGFLNRSGKKITLQQLIDGGKAGMNMGADFMFTIGSIGLGDSPFPLGLSFDLNQLDQHGFPIEHDGSLSREDAYFGNDYSFNQTDFNELLSYFHGPKTSLKEAAAGKFARVLDSKKRNPTMTYGVREFLFSYGESALYMQAMSDPYSGVARLDYVKSLFEQEKLPYDLGWRPSAQEVTLATLGQMIFELSAVSPEPVPEGLKITADTYKNALQILAGFGEIGGNLTSILLPNKPKSTSS